MNYGHPLTLLVAAYVLPAAMTTCTFWTFYLGTTPRLRRRKA